MRFEKARVNEILAVIENLRVRAGELCRLFRFPDIRKNAVLDECGSGKRPLLIHGDDVSENKSLFHDISLIPYETHTKKPARNRA
jgi:hypothetical protein